MSIFRPGAKQRVEPGPGQESVWDYPRPPALVQSDRLVRVEFGGDLIAETRAAYRVLETSHPPTWYLPPGDVVAGKLQRSRARSTMCEWKGAARYWDVVGPDGAVLAEAAAWSYPTPTPRFVPITDYVAFRPEVFDCSVDGERVRAQAGGFYGGWITDDVVGPFKGEPGTWGW